MGAIMQQELALIPHAIDGDVIEQRSIDGYVNATAMCRAAGKLFGHYAENRTTRAFLEELESVIGIPISELVQSVRGGGPSVQGTWVHPKVAIHLAQWLSPRFAVQVSEWVYAWMTGEAVRPARLPYHLRRYVKNRGHVPDGHFSILTEMTQLVIAPMEEAGYTLPERMLPDISQGRMFSRMLREELGVDTDTMPYYHHHYEDGRVVPARAYPDIYLPAFRRHLLQVWIPQKSIAYFRQRDTEALQYLPLIYPKAITEEV
jgi:hypothetical protein